MILCSNPLTLFPAAPPPPPLSWFLDIMSWNSSSILLYLASVLGVSVAPSPPPPPPPPPSPSPSLPSGLPGAPPLFSFLFRAWNENKNHPSFS